ncbi:MAG: hypothetical protein HZA89_07280 [Verrucomicrobia bacterium]|nr:hypothetical protein [Verrucomicrobiota bacterium]
MLAVSALPAAAQSPKKVPDQWLAGPAQFPAGIATNWLRAETFASLHAESLIGQVKIYLTTAIPTNATVTLYSSADEAGHWPARDWRSFPMSRRGGSWEATLPVDNVDVPLIYFTLAAAPGATNLSPMRRCLPRALGLEVPSRAFTPFLEGFEETLEGWRRVKIADGDALLQTDSLARHGRKSLRVQISPGQRSVTVATTCPRGWQIGQHGCSGLSLWLRTRAGSGQARFTLLANAATAKQVISPSTVTAELTAQWQKMELPFSTFPRLPLADVDLFTIEFVGAGGAEFLVDDLQYVSRQRLEVE